MTGQRFWRHVDGRVLTREITTSDGVEVSAPVPSGFVEVPADEGQRLVTEFTEAAEARAQQTREEAAAQAEEDYKALIDAGFPERLAARLSGHRTDERDGTGALRRFFNRLD